MEKIIMANFDANFDETRKKIKINNSVRLTHYSDEDNGKIGIHFRHSNQEDDSIAIYIEIEELFRFFIDIIKKEVE